MSPRIFWWLRRAAWGTTGPQRGPIVPQGAPRPPETSRGLHFMFWRMPNQHPCQNISQDCISTEHNSFNLAWRNVRRVQILVLKYIHIHGYMNNIYIYIYVYNTYIYTLYMYISYIYYIICIYIIQYTNIYIYIFGFLLHISRCHGICHGMPWFGTPKSELWFWSGDPFAFLVLDIFIWN